MRRVGALVVSALLVAGVIVAVVWNWRSGVATTEVTGVIGSEKAAFFADPDVVARLEELGYSTDIRTGGSREIATTDLDGVDFAFPSSDPSAEVLQRNNKVERQYRPFYSPMVVLSYRPVVSALEDAGVAAKADDGTWQLDMSAYLDLTAERTRWRDLPGDPIGSGRGEVLIRTTDPRTSNSAAMYLVVTSYLLNGEEVVQNTDPEPDLVDEAARLFVAQGSPPESSQQPFDEFVALGAGHTPLLWAYESQYITARTGSGLPDDVVLLYPGPTTVATHTLLPLTEEGGRLGKLLTEDPRLQRLAVEHGFRTTDTKQFTDLVQQQDLPVRDQVADVVSAPTYEVVEGLISAVEERYSAGGLPGPSKDGGAGPGTAGGTEAEADADADTASDAGSGGHGQDRDV